MEASHKPAVDGISIIPTSKDEFLRTWLEMMRPFHHLTPREMDFAAVMIAKREEIARDVTDQAKIDKLLFEEETKEEIMALAGVSKTHMQMILRSMRANGVIQGRRFNPSYLPSWTPGKPFRMVFVFKISET